MVIEKGRKAHVGERIAVEYEECPGIRGSGFGIRGSGFGIWDLGFGIRDSGFGVRKQGNRALRSSGGSEHGHFPRIADSHAERAAVTQKTRQRAGEIVQVEYDILHAR
jgi:hypothetical protein